MNLEENKKKSALKSIKTVDDEQVRKSEKKKSIFSPNIKSKKDASFENRRRSSIKKSTNKPIDNFFSNNEEKQEKQEKGEILKLIQVRNNEETQEKNNKKDEITDFEKEIIQNDSFSKKLDFSRDSPAQKNDGKILVENSKQIENFQIDSTLGAKKDGDPKDENEQKTEENNLADRNYPEKIIENPLDSSKNLIKSPKNQIIYQENLLNPQKDNDLIEKVSESLKIQDVLTEHIIIKVENSLEKNIAPVMLNSIENMLNFEKNPPENKEFLNSPFITEKNDLMALRVEKPDKIKISFHESPTLSQQNSKNMLESPLQRVKSKKVSFIEKIQKKPQYYHFQIFSRVMKTGKNPTKILRNNEEDDSELIIESLKEIDNKIPKPPKIQRKEDESYLTEEDDIFSVNKPLTIITAKRNSISKFDLKTKNPPKEYEEKNKIFGTKNTIKESKNDSPIKESPPQKSKDRLPEAQQINEESIVQTLNESVKIAWKTLKIHHDKELFNKLFSPFAETMKNISSSFTHTIFAVNLPPESREGLFFRFKLLNKTLKKTLSLVKTLILEFQKPKRPSKSSEKPEDLYNEDQFAKEIDFSAGYHTDQNKGTSSHFSFDYEDFRFSEKEDGSPEKKLPLAFQFNNSPNQRGVKKGIGKSRQIMMKYGEMADNIIKNKLPVLIKQKPRFALVISNIYKQISSIYQEALRLMRKNEDFFCELPAFLCDYFIQRFGLKKVAEAKISSFLHYLATGPFENNKKIRIFLRFLGLDEANPPFNKEFEFFLILLSKIDESVTNTVGIFINIERFMASWGRIILICDELFEPKAGRNRVFAFEKELSRKLGIGNTDDLVVGEDFDRLIEMMLEFYKEINADMFRIVFNAFGRREKTLNSEEMEILLRNFTEKNGEEIKILMKQQKSWDFTAFKTFFTEKIGINDDELSEKLGCEDFEGIKESFKKNKKEFSERLGRMLIYRKLLKMMDVCLEVNSRIAMRTMVVGFKVLMNEMMQVKIEEALIPEEFRNFPEF